MRSRTVVISTGARWRQMGVPGEDEYRNKGVTYCPHCDGPLFKGKRVAVIGGGNSGVEAAIDLAGIVGHVTLLEFDDAPPGRRGAPAQAAQPAQRRRDRAAPSPPRCVGDGDRVTGLVYTTAPPTTRHKVDLDGIFVQIGLLPNTEWLEGTVELSTRGEIVIDDRGQTSVPGRVRGRRLHDRAVQADRDRHGSRLDRGAERLRPPDPHLGTRAASESPDPP